MKWLYAWGIGTALLITGFFGNRIPEGQEPLSVAFGCTLAGFIMLGMSFLMEDTGKGRD